MRAECASQETAPLTRRTTADWTTDLIQKTTARLATSLMGLIKTTPAG